MCDFSTSVRCVEITVAASTTVKPRSCASSCRARVDPGGGQAEGRLQHVVAGQVDAAAHRIHRHELAGIDDAVAGIDLLDLDVVVVRLELDVVDDAHRRHDEAELGRELAAQRPHLVGQPVLPRRPH